MSRKRIDKEARKRSPIRQGRIAQERRAAVLKTAVRLFLEKGFEATSVSDIIAEVGGSRASLYGHFHSKEELFAAVMRDQIEAQSKTLLELHELTSNIEVALTEIGRQFLNLILDDTSRALQTIISHEAKNFPELGQMFLANGPERVVGALSDFIRRAHINNDLCVPDPEMAAWQFIMLCEANHPYLSRIAGLPRPSKSQCEESVDAAVHTFMAAFSPSN